MAFVNSPLDRKANHRSDRAWIEARSKSADARFLQLSGDGVRLDGSQLATVGPTEKHDLIFLGDDADGLAWFAFSAPAEGMSPLRPLMIGNELPPGHLAILAQARSIIHWHEKHGFCANCGTQTAMADAGYRRHCAACGTDHFPRTDPVVIMAVRHKGKILLGRQKSWAPGMYSAVAGFMEPGETMEQAVAREVLEETGIRVGKVSYVASQPWPFPSSLMIGCIAEATTDKIILDQKELENARWFTFAEVRLMLDHQHPEKLFASNPHAIAHHVISAALHQ